jgi:hypothetical protein
MQSIKWKTILPPECIQEIDSAYKDLHRLSNYPFDAKTITSKWHQAIIESELIRAEPGLVKGFQYTDPLIKIGSIQIDLGAISLERIKHQIMSSRQLLSKTFPLLFEELQQQTS